MKRVFFAVLITGVLALPALAATEYFVARDVATKQCSIVEAKPDGTTMTMVGASSYPTKDDAQAAMNTAPECQAS